MIIIWITWTLGSGKGTIVDYLVENKWFQHLSVRAFLIEEIKKRSMKIDRDSMTLVANDLRTKFGSSYIVEQLYTQAKASWKNSCIESIRAVGEVELLQKKENFYLFAIDADPAIRYERIKIRNSESDKVSYAKFLSDEQREMNTIDPTKQNLSRCMEMADHVFTNNWTLEELNQQIEEVINTLNI